MVIPHVFYGRGICCVPSKYEVGGQHDGYYRVLIMGDSEAKSAWLPDELSEDTYNFSLAGASPIDEYYCLKDYLEKNDAPEYLFYTQAAGHFVEADFFWSRMIYFHRMCETDFYDLLETLKDYKDVTLFGERNMKQEFLLYKYYFPTKYSSAFLKFLLGENRYDKCIKNYQIAEENCGQMQVGNADRWDEANKYAKWESFEANEIIDDYFGKLIDLCGEHGIKFIFQMIPYSESTYENLQPQFVSDYTSYLESLQEEHPDALIDHELVSYDNSYYGDAYHLNRRGTVRFSQEMREKYSEIFKTGGES